MHIFDAIEHLLNIFSCVWSYPAGVNGNMLGPTYLRHVGISKDLSRVFEDSILMVMKHSIPYLCYMIWHPFHPVYT